MRKSQRELLAESRRPKFKETQLDLDGLITLLMGGPVLPTQKRFIFSPDEGKAYKGPAGCAKTSTLCCAAWLRALLQPGSRGIICRHDYNDLYKTTMLRMEEMLSRLPPGIRLDRNKSAPETWYIRSPMTKGVDGTTEGPPSEIVFMGLKDGLGSLELSWACVDEADECSELRVQEIFARFRNSGGNYSLMLAFNPPDKHHWLYQACTGLDFQDQPTGNPPWLTLFEPLAKENVKNLDEGYYERMTARLSPDQRRRLVDGEWGGTFEGSPVYPDFRYDIHTREGLKFTKGITLLRFWDFGYRHPYCVWAQLSPRGHLSLLAEVLGQNTTARDFAQRIKAETASRFPDAERVLDFGDPAVKQQKDTGQALADFYKEGIQMLYRPSKIEEGVKVIQYNLNRMIQGDPVLQFDRAGVPLLITAMRGGYHLDKKGVKPEKDNFYDHPADAFRYGMIHLFGGGVGINHFDAKPIPKSVSYAPREDIYANIPSSVEDPHAYTSET